MWRPALRHVILGLYILIFATGFTGLAALVYLWRKSGSYISPVYLGIQTALLSGLGIVVFYYYMASAIGPSFPESTGGIVLSVLASLANIVIYAAAIIAIRRIRKLGRRTVQTSVPESTGTSSITVPSNASGSLLPSAETDRDTGRGEHGPRRLSWSVERAGEILSGFVILQGLVSVLLSFLSRARPGGAAAAMLGSAEWHLFGYVLVGLAMAAFGLTLRQCEFPGESPAVISLSRAYGLCILIYAPMGLIEYALNTAGLDALEPLSLDFFFYLAWNFVSMSAFLKAIVPAGREQPLEASVSESAVAAFGLTGRERQMAILIARGLANKEIASELNISPATVRTHIYNLYRKVGAESRIDLLNRLRG